MTATVKKLREAAVSAHQAGKLQDASEMYARYLGFVPNDGGIWSNLGVLNRKVGRHIAAYRAHERARALAPDNVSFMSNMANLLSDIGQYDESIALRERVLDENPGALDHIAMIGRCLRGKGDYADAISYLKRARKEYPDDAELQMQLAFAQLGAGQHSAGLHNYKARWRAGELQPRDLPFPEWDGEPLAGKTLAILPEQGFGDAILFARFMDVLRGQGAHVVLATKKPLVRLFSQLSGVDELVEGLTKNSKIDYWVNMMDIAAYYFDRMSQVPPPAQVHVPDAATARAKSLTAPYKNKTKIGVVWTGSVTYKANAFRSFSHTEYLPLTDLPGVQLFSLYKGPELAAYHADGSDAFIVDVGSMESDFADCAAMMQDMDLIITSDTATAHLAGSLGVEVWTVLHWDAFWVWQHQGDTTAWYPSMRLFRQTEPLKWAGVMDQVKAELLTWMEMRK